VKKDMHLILHSSTGALVTVAISIAPDRGFHSESVCTQTKPAHIPHNLLREVKVRTDPTCTWAQVYIESKVASGGQPHSARECVNQLEALGGKKQTKFENSPVVVVF